MQHSDVQPSASTSHTALEPQPRTLAAITRKITWYGQNSLRIELAGKSIWIDPVGIPLEQKADLILVTHNHRDHFSVPDIRKLSDASTQVMIGFDGGEFACVKPGMSFQIDGVLIEAVPAYNIQKTNCHPKSSGFCGFILSGEGVKIYDSGDTERIPEMKGIRCDIAFLPLGQTYTMASVQDAVLSAVDVSAKIAIPVHYAMYEGTEQDADDFVATLKRRGVEAFRLPRSKGPKC